MSTPPRTAPELFDMTGHVAVITGGGRGIGEGIARAFAESGAAVVVAARRTNEIEQVAADICGAGGRAIAITTDVTDDDAVDALARAAIDEFGSLTVWVNNAGGSPMRMPLKDLPREEWDRTIALNLTSVYVGSMTAARYIEHGSIINISSIASTHSLGYSCISYSASKGAVNAFTRDIALNYGPKGIRCNSILPGLMNTPLIHAGNVTSVYGSTEAMVAARDALVPLGQMGDGWDVAHASVFLASDEAKHITGIELVVDGGITLKVK